MVALALASLAVLAGSRAGLLHEMMTGQQADQQRAQAMAEALALDAEADIQGRPGNAPCRPSAIAPQQSAPGFIGCRERGTGPFPAAPYFPRSVAEFEEVRALLQVGAAIPCRDGICAPSSLHALSVLGEAPQAAQALGARYGQFTQATQPAGSLSAQAGQRAWVWVEIFRLQTGAATPTAQTARPGAVRPFVYRITAVAEGMRPGTRAVVKTLFVPETGGAPP
ncbi:MAG TPA: hypothetical protein VMS38_27190 [Pseudorhodoferax sp.]|jgi:type IV pilus assembly protein PilX|nr:hypothetical protein [Pseudorhodoferax sp.]